MNRSSFQCFNELNSEERWLLNDTMALWRASEKIISSFNHLNWIMFDWIAAQKEMEVFVCSIFMTVDIIFCSGWINPYLRGISSFYERLTLLVLSFITGVAFL